MKNIDKLRKKIINNIIAFTVITALVGGIGVGLAIYMFTDTTTNNGFNTLSIIGISFALIVIAVVFIGGVIALIQLCRDLKNVKHQKIITVTGIAKKHIWDSGGDGPPSIIGAVVLTEDNEEIRLSVGELILGEKYTFQYSPLTKTAVIIDGENKKSKSYFANAKLPFWAAPAIFLCLAIALGATSLVTFNRVDKLVKNGIITTATVDEIKTSSDGDGGTQYTVYIKYIVDGTTYREKLRTSSRNNLQIGEELEIRYLPDNPTIFMQIHDEYAIPIIFGTFSGISLVAGLSFLIVALVKRKRVNKKNHYNNVAG